MAATYSPPAPNTDAEVDLEHSSLLPHSASSTAAAPTSRKCNASIAICLSPLLLILSLFALEFHGLPNFRMPSMFQTAVADYPQPLNTAFQPTAEQRVTASGNMSEPLVFLDIDSTAGIGDQLQMHLLGVTLAAKHGLIYVSKRFTMDRNYDWNDFFGLTRNELTWPEILYISDPSQQRQSIDHRLLTQSYKEAADNELELLDIVGGCKQRQQECYVTMTNTLLPFKHEDVVCDPFLNQQLRRKYCLQRLELPIPPPEHDNVWNTNGTTSSTKPVVPVALHHRSGDLADGGYCLKKQPLDTIIATMPVIARILDHMGCTAAFHVYSEVPGWNQVGQPHNITDDYFRQLFTDSRLVSAGIVPHLHVQLRTELTLHRMITAPILVTSGSGFSMVTSLLREGLTLAIRPSCSNRTVHLQVDGAFDEHHFTSVLQQYAQTHRLDQWAQYVDMQTCRDIQPWQQLNTYQPNATYMQQGFNQTC